MPIDTSSPGSPGWWLKRLVVRLDALRTDYQKLDDYYTGTANVPVLATKAVRQAYARLMQVSKTNFAELVVEATRERLNPVNFRTGAAGDLNGDGEAWRIWQANQLDADSAIVHRWALTMRDAYCIVGPVDPETEAPLVTIEDPRYVTVEYEPANRRRARAALKMVRDDVRGVDLAYLFLIINGAGWVLTAVRPTSETRALVSFDGFDWAGQQRLPFPVIPVVGFHNRYSDRSWGEFEPHLALLDRINYGILNRLTIATLQAFRQRALKGGPTHDEAGNPINYADVFDSDPASIWHLPGNTDLWESGQVDLGPLQKSIRDDVQDLAAVTRTPLFYLTPDAANGSAEGASLAREGLVYKVEERQKQFGESWEQVMSLAFLFANDPERASRRDMEIVWAPAERFSLAERYDAASKAGPAGLPWRAVMEEVLQLSPQYVDRLEADRAADALVTAQANGDNGDVMSPADLANAVQSIYLGVGKVLSADEAREILNRAGARLTGPAPVAVDG